MKRMACCVLCTLILAAALFGRAEGTAYTCGDYSYTLNEDGSAVITGYTGRAKELKIPADLDGHPVKEIGGSAFYGREDLTAAMIPFLSAPRTVIIALFIISAFRYLKSRVSRRRNS